MHDGEALVAPAVAPGDMVRARPRSLDASQNALPCKRLSSTSLLAGMNEIEIEHGSSIYRLRLTSLGKLILTK